MQSLQRTFFLVILLLISGGIQSQEKTPSFGVMTGLNFSSFDEGRYKDYDFFIPGTGYFLGVSYDTKIWKRFELNIESNLSRGIVREKYLVEDGPLYHFSISDYRIKSTYLSLPLSINYAMDRLGIQLGIYNDFLLSRSFLGSNVNPELAEIDLNHKFDTGVIIGGHYDFYNLEIGIRKYIGLINHQNILISDGFVEEEISLFKTDQLQFFIKYHL